jgi:site-specific DNA-methyltransferase (adenine-specific)
MWKIINRDVIEWAEEYEGPSFHSLFCDPPYNLDTIVKRFGNKNSAPAHYYDDGAFLRSSSGFLGAEWDTDIVFDPDTWKALKRVLYPGAMCIAYIHSRTYHRMAMAIETAGFVIHPMIGWINAQGFPKGAKVKDEVWSEHRYGRNALKRALEPLCVFQKPFGKNPQESIIKTGAGTFWIEGTRIGNDDVVNNRYNDGMKPFGKGAGHSYSQSKVKGRWPANVVLTGDVGDPYETFFYCAKPVRRERDAGLDDMPDVERFTRSSADMIGISGDRTGDGKKKPIPVGKSTVKNPHPTVKPIKLNTYLAKLFLPPEEYNPRRILVPFSGSGSEMIGALLADWDEVLGIEIDQDNCAIAEKRLEYWINDKEK